MLLPSAKQYLCNVSTHLTCCISKTYWSRSQCAEYSFVVLSSEWSHTYKTANASFFMTPTPEYIFLTLTWPVCSVSSLLIRYIRKNLHRGRQTWVTWRSVCTFIPLFAESLTGSWRGCALVRCGFQTREASDQSSHSQCHRWSIWSGRKVSLEVNILINCCNGSASLMCFYYFKRVSWN